MTDSRIKKAGLTIALVIVAALTSSSVAEANFGLYNIELVNQTQSNIVVTINGRQIGTLPPGNAYQTDVQPMSTIHLAVGRQFKQFNVDQNGTTVNIGNFNWREMPANNGGGWGDGGGFGGGGFEDEHDWHGDDRGGDDRDWYGDDEYDRGPDLQKNINPQIWAQEALEAFNYINQVRIQKGLQPVANNNQLRAAAEWRARSMADQVHELSDAFAATEHINMNAKVREFGYPLPHYMPNNANNVESTWGSGGSDFNVRGIGRQLVDTFLSEGPGGGHYDAIMHPNAKDVGIGFAVNAKGEMALGAVLVVSPN